MKNLRLVISCVAALWYATMAQGQTKSRAQLIENLRASDPLQRASAFGQLSRGGPAAFDGADMPKILVELLERENALMYKTLRESDNGISGKYGEGFAEYYGQMLDVCIKRCDRSQARTIEALANSGYSPSSGLAADLARNYSHQALPVFARKARDGAEGPRVEGVAMMAKVAALQPRLSEQDRSMIHRAVVTAARDKSAQVRQLAVRVLGYVGTKDDVPLLKQIMRSDTARVGAGGASVRDEARATLSKLSPPIQ
jgi:hypothetical protein